MQSNRCPHCGFLLFDDGEFFEKAVVCPECHTDIHSPAKRTDTDRLHADQKHVTYFLLSAGFLAGAVFVYLAEGLFEERELKWAVAGSLAVASIALFYSAVQQLRYARNPSLRSKLEEKYPDFLEDFGAPIFERQGLDFLFVPQSVEGKTVISLYFQNRYANRCHATVYLTGPGRRPTIYAFECGGGCFGVVRKPFPLPRGVPFEFKLCADVKYPQAKGEMVRLWRGIECPGRPKSGSSLGDSVLLNLLTLPFGTLILGGGPRTLTITLLDDAPAAAGKIHDGVPIVLWRPEDDFAEVL